MNSNIALPYKQNDPRWAGKLLGDSGLAIGRYGCYTAVSAAILAGTYKVKNRKGEPLTPGDLCDMLSVIGGYNENGQIMWWALARLFPECKLWTGAWTSALRAGQNGNFQVVDQGAALENVKEALRAGIGIGICVDAVLGDDVKPDHIVALVHAPNDPSEWLIMDPITGRFDRFMERYGDPRSGVLGYRVISGPPTEFPPYSTSDDQDDGIAFWKAVQIADGKNVETYARELAETIMFVR